MDFGEVDSLALHPYNTKKKIKNMWNKSGPDLFGSVSVLGCGSGLVGGECNLAVYF